MMKIWKILMSRLTKLKISMPFNQEFKANSKKKRLKSQINLREILIYFFY